MAINIEFQGDFQYLKYEFAPRLRQLVKNVHTSMNSYNNAFFLQCQKFGDMQAIAREAQQSGKLPTAVEQAMIKADAFKPLAEGILLKKVANQISSFAFFNGYYWGMLFDRGGSVSYNRGFVDFDNMRSSLGHALLYALYYPFLQKIQQGRHYAYGSRPEFGDFYGAKPFTGNDKLIIAPMRFAKKIRLDNTAPVRFPRLETCVYHRGSTRDEALTQSGVGADNPYQTRQERLGEIFAFYFVLNEQQLAVGQPLKRTAAAQKYYFFSKKDFYTLSEECVIARLWNFFAKPLAMNGWEVNMPPQVNTSYKQSPVCDYFGRDKQLTTQGSFQERLNRFTYPKTEILQVPAFTEAELQEAVKLLEGLKKANAAIFKIDQSDIGITSGDPRILSALVEKTRYYEQKHPTNHLDIAPWVDRYSTVKIKKLPDI